MCGYQGLVVVGGKVGVKEVCDYKGCMRDPCDGNALFPSVSVSISFCDIYIYF